MRALAERAALGGLVLASVLGAHLLWSDPAQRAERLYVGVLTLGYGHLIGALWMGWPRLRARRPAGAAPSLFGLWLASGALVAFSLYGALLERAPWLPVLLLGLSVWHTVENDLALFRGGRLAERPPDREADPARRALGVAWTLAFGILVTATPLWQAHFAPVLGGGSDPGLRLGTLAAAAFAAWRGGAAVRAGAAPPALAALLPAPPLALVDLFAVSTLYHLFTWLAVLGLRLWQLVRRGEARRARGLGGRLLAVHAAPAAACALAFASGPASPASRWLLDPGLYLFWASLHVLQSAWIRPASPRAVGDAPCAAPSVPFSSLASLRPPPWRPPSSAARPEAECPTPTRDSRSTRSAPRWRFPAAG